MNEPRSDPEESILKVIRRAIAEAPRGSKRMMRLNAIVVGIAITVFVVDSILDPPHDALPSVAAVVLAMGGIFCLALATILHSASQRKGAVACAKGSLFSPRSEHMDRMFLALPVMGVIAAVLMAGSAVFSLMTMRLDSFRGAFAMGLMAIMMLVYLVAAVRLVAHASRFVYRYASEQAQMAARAREEATQAQLAALQAQMNPHFLFNALNTVASLVRTNGRSAEAAILNLASILRRTLERSRSPIETLRDEVEFLRAYLGVEQERWGERLSVRWDLAPETLDLPLPPMILQPLVENALAHGLHNRIQGGEVRIESTRMNGRLLLRVFDNGAGLPARWHEGTGLGNLRRRLETLYGSEAALRVEDGHPGTRVIVEIPVGQPPPPA